MVRSVSIALVVPICVMTTVLAGIGGGERLGATPFAGTMPRNSAEAAAMGSAHEVLRFLRRGDDPRQVQTLSPAIISSSVQRATTIEAAVWAREPAMIHLLDREGAIPQGAERTALACLAVDLDLGDVAAYLAPGGVGACMPGEAVERVMARTRDRGGDQ